jgi:hypothetical protein
MAGFAVTLHGRIWVSPEAPPKIASRARIPSSDATRSWHCGVSRDTGASATISSVLVSTSIQARDRLFYGERLTVSFRLF